MNDCGLFLTKYTLIMIIFHISVCSIGVKQYTYVKSKQTVKMRREQYETWSIGTAKRQQRT